MYYVNTEKLPLNSRKHRKNYSKEQLIILMPH